MGAPVFTQDGKPHRSSPHVTNFDVVSVAYDMDVFGQPIDDPLHTRITSGAFNYRYAPRITPDDPMDTYIDRYRRNNFIPPSAVKKPKIRVAHKRPRTPSDGSYEHPFKYGFLLISDADLEKAAAYRGVTKEEVLKIMSRQF